MADREKKRGRCNDKNFENRNSFLDEIKNIFHSLWSALSTIILEQKWQKQPPEMFCKKVFLQISQNSQENTCARVSFLIKLQATSGLNEEHFKWK